MLRKFKFFAIGLIPGLLIVFFVLNQKGARCTGYLPSSRVVAETLSKPFAYSEAFKAQMQSLKITDTYLKDSIVTNGVIDFDRSHAQQKPCPDYVMKSPEKTPKYELTFVKCKDKITFTSIKQLP